MSSSWALIENDGSILLIRRALERGRGGQWCLPGGTMWKNESPAVACVRETFEETGLRVTIDKPLAIFKDAHYFLCQLNGNNQTVKLREEEAIDYRWLEPRHILSLGTIMDLRRLVPIMEHVGLQTPVLPQTLKMAVPESLF